MGGGRHDKSDWSKEGVAVTGSKCLVELTVGPLVILTRIRPRTSKGGKAKEILWYHNLGLGTKGATYMSLF